MTLYFSHPAIEGVLFWGFWDGKIWKPESALFEGPDVTVSICYKLKSNRVSVKLLNLTPRH